MTNTQSSPCHLLERRLADYLAGSLPEDVAVALEAHAAQCPACEARFEAATRRALSFAPELPPGLRDSTLRAVATRRSGADRAATSHVERSVRWRAGGGMAALAAAAVLIVFVLTRVDRREAATGGGRLVDTARVATVAADSPVTDAPRMDGEIGPMQSASRIAESQARSEFAELDAAARELEAALAASPTDRELRGFLSTVRARRDELSRRVKDATS